MFRFTIRDVLWLMVVVGLGICWYRASQSAKRLNTEVVALKNEFAAERDKAKKQFSALAEVYRKERIKSELQESALERWGIKADPVKYRVGPK